MGLSRGLLTALFLVGGGGLPGGEAWSLGRGTLAQAAEVERLSGSSTFSREAILSGRELHRWERHVRGFRREHNFALSLGVSSGTWDVDNFGSLSSRKFEHTGLFARFQYSFHIPLYRGFGYVLGSSVGYHYESTDRRRPFKPVAAVMFPGLLAGLTLNVTPALRATIAADAYLERHDGIKERDGREPDPEISVTLQTYDIGAYFDLFYDLKWAVRIEAHYRLLQFLRPEGTSGRPIDAKLRKTDRWLGFGVLYHLL